jgi:hypothetical protein
MIGMKDYIIPGALDVKGPAVIATFPAVRDQGIHLLLTLAKRLEMRKRVLHPLQVHGETRQIRPGQIHLPGGIGCLPTACRQYRLESGQLRAFALQPFLKPMAGDQPRLHFGRRFASFHLHFLKLGANLLILLHKLLVQQPSSPFPFSPVGGCGPLLLRCPLCPGLFHGSHRLDAGDDFRPAVNHEKQQDQRAHGAQEHREERKGRNL